MLFEVFYHIKTFNMAWWKNHNCMKKKKKLNKYLSLLHDPPWSLILLSLKLRLYQNCKVIVKNKAKVIGYHVLKKSSLEGEFLSNYSRQLASSWPSWQSWWPSQRFQLGIHFFGWRHSNSNRSHRPSCVGVEAAVTFARKDDFLKSLFSVEGAGQQLQLT